MERKKKLEQIRRPEWRIQDETEFCERFCLEGWVMHNNIFAKRFFPVAYLPEKKSISLLFNIP